MKVFISHSGVDRWVARQLSHLIESNGHSTFLDEKDIKTGDPIDSSIQQHLKECDHLLLLLSPASIGSHWVLVELGGAKALDKKVIPILLHLGANEIPSVISQLLARDINEFDKYMQELEQEDAPKPAPARTKAEATTTTSSSPAEKKVRRRTKSTDFPVVDSWGELSKGDRVRIVEVERLTDSDKTESPKWVRGMDKYSGAITRIVGLYKVGGSARIEADDGKYWWAPRWLFKVE